MNCPKPRNIFIASLIIAIFIGLVSGEEAFAQTTLVVIEGNIADNTGTPLPGAAVSAINMDTGYEYGAMTRPDGTYIVSGIEPGKYEVQVSLTGFSTQIRRGMTFSVGAKLKIDFTLVPAKVEEEIIVTAEAPMIEVTKSEISSIIDRQKIDDLPLLNRNFAALTDLKAGVIYGRSNAMPGGMGEILIDGISNEHMINNDTRMPMPADAIQEFRVLTNQYEAEYGNAAGMIRSAATRSGTNQMRGRVSFFLKDEVLDTPNYFVNHDRYKGEKIEEVDLPDYQHLNFSGFFGGPIKKDKAHFFIAFEGLSEKTYATITSPLVVNETIEVPNRIHNLLVKCNYQLNQKNLFSFHYSLLRKNAKNLGVGGLNTKEMAYDYPNYGDDFRLTWTHFPSHAAMNELRILFSADHFKMISDSPDAYSIARPSGYFGKATNIPQSGWTKTLHILDHLSLFWGNHNIKLGIDYLYGPGGGNVTMCSPGYFGFETDDPFDPADPFTYPSQFMTMVGDRIFTMTNHRFSLFAQDSWKVIPRLTLNLGCRYNYYSFEGINYKKFHFPANLNPRLAFSWDPFGDGKTSIRGGFGVYTGNLFGNASFMQVYLTLVKMRIIMFPNYPDPYLDNPFWPFWEEMLGMPEGFLSQQNMTFGFGTYTSMENQAPPYTLQTTLGIHRELGTNLALSADLVWSRGAHLLRHENSNPIIVGTKTQHEDPTKGDVYVITDGGKSDYKGIYITLNKRYHRGWSLDISYTLSWSKSDTEMVGYVDNYDEDGWDRQFGYTNNDARHKITAAGIIDLPLGFQLSSIISYRSKTPWTAFYGYDENLDGLNSDYIDYNRNSRRGFDYFSINARISKFINISLFRLQFFIEMYNVLNRANFYSVSGYELSPYFGEPTQAHDPRLIQLGARIDF